MHKCILSAWMLGRSRRSSLLRTSMADCVPHPDACAEDRRVTAPNPEGAFEEEARLASTTPERDDEGKRRRISTEPSSTAGGSSSCTDEGGHLSRSSSGACSTSSSGTHVEDGEALPLDQKLEGMLRDYLTAWGERLVQLQPKVYMNEHLIECGLYLFKYLRSLQVEAALEHKFPMQYLTNQQLLIHDLVSCWWIALKHASVRTAVPNRTLMCRATGTAAELLNDRELAALIAIDWEVQAVLKKGNLVL